MDLLLLRVIDLSFHSHVPVRAGGHGLRRLRDVGPLFLLDPLLSPRLGVGEGVLVAGSLVWVEVAVVVGVIVAVRVVVGVRVIPRLAVGMIIVGVEVNWPNMVGLDVGELNR